MEKLGRRVRVRHDADSDSGRAFAGRSGEIEQFSRNPETMELQRYTVRLDDGTQINLRPQEVDLLD